MKSLVLVAATVLISAPAMADVFRGYLVKKEDGVYFSGVNQGQLGVQIHVSSLKKSQKAMMESCMVKRKKLIEVETTNIIVNSMSIPGRFSAHAEVVVDSVKCKPGKVDLPAIITQPSLVDPEKPQVTGYHKAF